MAKVKLIVMSHGNMALETLKSAQMIVGDTEDVGVVSMEAEDGLSGTTEKLADILTSSDSNQEWLIVADLKGGTPCNVALMSMATYPNLRVVSGLNLAMMIKALMSPLEKADALGEYLMTIGKEAVLKIELPELTEDEYED